MYGPIVAGPDGVTFIEFHPGPHEPCFDRIAQQVFPASKAERKAAAQAAARRSTGMARATFGTLFCLPNGRNLEAAVITGQSAQSKGFGRR
jgi:hypothetical protein